MVANALHCILHISQVERFVHRMTRVARHPKLLPNHDAVLITQFVEAVALSNATSPQTQKIETRLVCVRQLRLHSLVVGAEHSLRNPVVTAHKGLVAIHNEDLRLVRSLARCDDFANTETRRKAIHHTTFAVGQGEAECIEILRTFVLWPPKARILNNQLRVVFRRECDCCVLTALQLYLFRGKCDVSTFNSSAHNTLSAFRIGVPYFHTHRFACLVIVRVRQFGMHVWAA